MKILVVEDEAHVAEVLCRALEATGHECSVATDPTTAERLLGAGPVDGITLDLSLAGADGLDWLEALAAREPDLARRTLVITGRWLEPETVSRLARCGAGALCKPFTIDGLHEAVRTQLKHAARHD